MKLPAWLRRARQDGSEPRQPLSPIELYEASGKTLSEAPPHTQDILREAERSHQRRSRTLSDTLHAHEVSPDDAALIRMLAGSKFSSNSTITLPSGKTITGAEMARWLDQ